MRLSRSLGFRYLPLLLLPILAAPGWASPVDPLCRPSGQVADVLDQVREIRGECGFGAECTARMLAILEPAVAEHPDELHLRRELQSVWRYGSVGEDRKADQEEYLARDRALAETDADDAVSLYLAGRATEDPAAGGELYRRALEVDPTFPWAHLGVLASAWTSSLPPDPELERRHLAGFLDRCPAMLSVATPYARALKNDPYWRERVAAGRAALLERDLADWYEELGASWNALYTSTPLAEQPALAPEVREEIARVEALGLESDSAWWQTLAKGYELVGDQEAGERIAEARMERFPCSYESVSRRMEAWQEEHPEPDASADEEAKARHATALWKRTGVWLEECPDAEGPWISRLHAATAGAELSDAELTETVDGLMALAASGRVQFGISMETLVASLYLDREVHLDRVDELVATGLEKDLERIEENLANPAYPAEIKTQLAEQIPSTRYNALATRTRAALARGEIDATHERLAESAAFLEETRPADDATDAARQLHQGHQASHLKLSADLAAAEERHADAAVLYARSAGLRPDSEEILEKGWEAWSAAGGSAQGWQSLSEGLTGTAPEVDRTALRWKDMEKALPAAFEVADLAGESWARADFEGKTVFVNLWATWCGPCRKELPEVEKLYELTRERDDVKVVTFNIDANPGAALRYAEEEGFTFPVLLAGDLVNEMGGVSGIPRSWIVDPSATVRREQLGFGEAEGWIDEVMELLERYAEDGTD